jgi:sirohydrochlorin ferrochelatase
MQALVPAAVASSTPVVLLGHGSPDPRSATAVRAVADLLSRRRAAPVVAAFLDHDEPRLPDVDLDDGSAVLPLLLSSAYHARIDVPAAVAALATRVELLSPLGHPPGVLDAVVRDAGASAVVVVAAGTSDENEREVFASAVHDAGRRTGISTRWAFATGSGPRLADVAASSATVVPWLLAPGRLLDAVRAQASANGSPVAGVALLGCPSLQSHLAMLLSC